VKAMKAHRKRVEVKFYSFFNLCTRWGEGVNTMPQLLSPWERDLVPIVSEAGWTPGLDWLGVIPGLSDL